MGLKMSWDYQGKIRTYFFLTSDILKNRWSTWKYFRFQLSYICDPVIPSWIAKASSWLIWVHLKHFTHTASVCYGCVTNNPKTWVAYNKKHVFLAYLQVVWQFEAAHFECRSLPFSSLQSPECWGKGWKVQNGQGGEGSSCNHVAGEVRFYSECDRKVRRVVGVVATGLKIIPLGRVLFKKRT